MVRLLPTFGRLTDSASAHIPVGNLFLSRARVRLAEQTTLTESVLRVSPGPNLPSPYSQVPRLTVGLQDWSDIRTPHVETVRQDATAVTVRISPPFTTHREKSITNDSL